MDIQIRKSTPDEVPAIVRLMRDFAEYENLGEYCEITEQRLFEVMFGDDAFVEGLVAFHDNEPVAYAMFYHAFYRRLAKRPQSKVRRADQRGTVAVRSE